MKLTFAFLCIFACSVFGVCASAGRTGVHRGAGEGSCNRFPAHAAATLAKKYSRRYF